MGFWGDERRACLAFVWKWVLDVVCINFSGRIGVVEW